MQLKNKYLLNFPMIKGLKLVTFLGFIVMIVSMDASDLISADLPNPYIELAEVLVLVDTIPMKDRKGDFITDKNKNPFDITPSNVKKEITYDPVSRNYIITEKIGNEYYRSPTYLTFEEYLEYKSKEQEKSYFEKLSGINQQRKTTGLPTLDPMSKVDIKGGLVNRLFGGTEVNIKPRGSVDLTLGFFDYQLRKDPSLPLRQQRQLFIPGEFNMQPRLNVDGGIGEKMKIGFNYDNQSTLNFDQKINIKYDADAFSEDDIIKNIEAGNVSLPLKGTLIPGIQSLFGVRTDMQFGKLRLSAIAAQQRSRNNNLSIQNGTANQEIEIRPDNYDENRHFFLSFFNRETYEKTLANLPQINTSFRIAQVEVWISDDRTDYQQGSTMVAALADIGEGDLKNYTNKTNPFFNPVTPLPSFLQSLDGTTLPDNRANPLYETIINDPAANELDKTASVLSGGRYRLLQTRDFEIFRGRLLNQSEYTFNPQLGTISLNIRLRPNQVLAASFKYYYTAKCDTVYTVGQLAGEGLESSVDNTGVQVEVKAPKVIFTKLLKSTNQRSNLPSWGLMMKNFYNLNTSQLSREGFNFDIFYEDDFDDGSLKKFLPEEGFRNKPLLQIFGLDQLNRFGDPQADGIFDYVPGVTVIERTGSIAFPVLEPFGKTLANLLQDPELIKKYVYQPLYDTTITIARQSLELNKFVMRATVKSSNSGEYNLGGLFIPRGSVRVTAGGIALVEGQDYEIDYGLGRLRVINPSYLSQSTPINISFEDNATFGLQQKSMLGLRADYALNKKMNIGATYMRLWDRPFSNKVNIGEDPVNNKVFGVDFNYSTLSPFLTNLVDKLPFYSTSVPSNITVAAEAAYLKPGYNSAIRTDKNDSETSSVLIDDFEGAISGLTLGGFATNIWKLSSTPPEFSESTFTDDLRTNANRARINWYQLDRAARVSQADADDSYTRIIDQTELFNRQVQIGQTEQYTFDIGFYPQERGPYNFDIPAGYAPYTKGVSFDISKQLYKLKEPKTRWGGIMRYFQNSDFEAANYEFIDFWVLNPFMERRDGETALPGEEGEMVIHLGNVSEDIIKDNLQFYENALPLDDTNLAQFPIKETNLGRVPINVPIANGFDIAKGKQQDLGYDGLDDGGERTKFKDWLTEMFSINNGTPVAYLNEDPSGDNFKYFNDPSLANNPNLISRLKDFNNPQGNAPLDNTTNNNNFIRGDRFPESEDLNNNRSLDQGEGYHEYRLKFKNSNGEIDTTAVGIGQNLLYYKQVKLITVGSGANRKVEKWYRFQIPLSSGQAKNIAGFRAIQFMRMYFTNFERAKTFRFAEFQLVRSTWRRSNAFCGSDFGNTQIQFSIDEVGVEENSTKQPFNYITPPGVLQERLATSYAGGNLLQDEKSLSLNFCNLGQQCQAGINKLTTLNLNLYKKVQLLVHAEGKQNTPIPDGRLAIVLKIGKDMVNNYYEYEVPLRMSNSAFANVRDSIWLLENRVDIDLSKFLDVKKMKIKDGILVMDDPDKPGAKIRIKGVPSLGQVKVMEILIRNLDSINTYCGEVWVNELRMSGLSTKPSVAALARVQMQVADLADINFATNFSSVGYGGLDQQIQDRSLDEIFQYSFSSNLQIGKLLPKFIPLNLPMFFSYSKSINTPKYDPYQLDLTVDEMADLVPVEQREAIFERARETTTLKSLNFTNIRKDGGNGGKPWSPENLNASYAYNEIVRTDPIIEEDKTVETSVGVQYNYTNKGLPIKPFKFIKSKYLKFISEFNFNPLPERIGFTTTLDRFNNSRSYRLPDTPVFVFDDQRFKWDRNYNLDWKIANSLRFTFAAKTTALVDELRQTGIAETAAGRDWVDQFGTDFTDQVRQDPGLVSRYRNDNLRDLGRAKYYNHTGNLSYTLPFALIPMMEWVNVSADYNTTYNWTAGALIYIDELQNQPGNIIQNSVSKSANGTFSFDRLYGKIGYLKRIESGGGAGATPERSRARPKPTPSGDNPDSPKTAADDKAAQKREKASEGPRVPSIVERILIRPLLSLRTIKVQYKEDLGTLVPGFKPEASLLGLSDGFTAPGFGFAAGSQPNLEKGAADNWLMNNQSWFNTSANFNDQIIQNEKQTFSSKVTLEPFKSFIVDLDFTKTYRKDHTEVFKTKGGGDFMQLAKYDIGSYDYTFIGLNTMFENSFDVYSRFKQFKTQVSNDLLPNKAGAGTHPDDPAYKEGYGPTSYAVNVPAFLAAYTGKLPSEVPLDLNADVARTSFIPKPNWSLRYDGLSKLAFFRDILSSFTLRHGYRSTLNVSKFNSTPDFRDDQPFDLLSANNNYYSRLEIPAMSINEQFSPLIGIQLKTKNNINLNVEYKKSRQLDLRLNANELSETKGTEMVFGFGYVIQNFKGFSRVKKKRAGRGGAVDNAPVNNTNVLQSVKNRSLTTNIDFSLRDDRSTIFRLENDNPAQPNRGQRSVTMRPNIEYQMYKNLAIRLFADYSHTTPYVNNSFPITRLQAGTTVRFTFN